MGGRVLVVLVASTVVLAGSALAQGRFAPPPPPAPQPVFPPSFDATPSGIPDPIVRPAGPNDVFRAGARTYAPRFTPRFDRQGRRPPRLFFPGSYAIGGYLPYYPDERYPHARAEQEMPTQGRMILSVTPESAQVFVDEFYVGVVSDFQDRGMWLETGPHRIEFRANGHESVAFEVRISEERTIEFRRELAREAARPEPPRVAATPKTFYVIPGCYAGDSPPQASRLPSGCSRANLRTVPPVLNRVAQK